MAYHEGPLILPDGSPVVPDDSPHACIFPTGWREPYSHATVALIMTNADMDIAAVVKRQPNEPAEGGKTCLPGGYVELWQTLFGAAETEGLEETGHLLVPRTLGLFAIMDGPMHFPGRQNEHDGNVVMVFSAQAGEKVQEHDDEVTEVRWISRDTIPPREEVAFGHYDIMRMWFRHQVQPFSQLPIMPSLMATEELFLDRSE